MRHSIEYKRIKRRKKAALFASDLQRTGKWTTERRKNKRISLWFGDFDIIFVVVVVVVVFVIIVVISSIETTAHQACERARARSFAMRTSLASYSTITRYYTSCEKMREIITSFILSLGCRPLMFANIFWIHKIADAQTCPNPMWIYCFQTLIVILIRPCVRIKSTDWHCDLETRGAKS